MFTLNSYSMHYLWVFAAPYTLNSLSTQLILRTIEIKFCASSYLEKPCVELMKNDNFIKKKKR